MALRGKDSDYDMQTTDTRRRPSRLTIRILYMVKITKTHKGCYFEFACRCKFANKR